jgi:predicted kinase
VKVDPDEIRRQLPEFMLYASLCPEDAGERTNKECGYISEIITLAGLESGKNVLVDGSLRDSEWYKLYFKMLREKYSHLKIAILHVVAPREAVFQRALVSYIHPPIFSCFCLEGWFVHSFDAKKNVSIFSQPQPITSLAVK